MTSDGPTNEHALLQTDGEGDEDGASQGIGVGALGQSEGVYRHWDQVESTRAGLTSPAVNLRRKTERQKWTVSQSVDKFK